MIDIINYSSQIQGAIDTNIRKNKGRTAFEKETIKLVFLSIINSIQGTIQNKET
jgi:hypothetical protein